MRRCRKKLPAWTSFPAAVFPESSLPRCDRNAGKNVIRMGSPRISGDRQGVPHSTNSTAPRSFPDCYSKKYMRGARWLLLLAICAILGWLRFAYLNQRRAVEANAPAKPAMLPMGIDGKAEDWHRVETDEKGHKVVERWARTFKEENDSARVQLEGV